jgi:hypothetical protein
MTETLKSNLSRCHKCLFANGRTANPTCPVDNSSVVERAEKADCQRGYHDGTDRPIERIEPPESNGETVKQNGDDKPRPRPNMSMAAAWAMAAMLGKWASDGEAAKRAAQCGKCDKLGEDKNGKYCKVCGCGVFAEDRAVKNLAAYRENLKGLPGYNPKLPQWGCKHPLRGQLKKPWALYGERFGWDRPGIPLTVISS